MPRSPRRLALAGTLIAFGMGLAVLALLMVPTSDPPGQRSSAVRIASINVNFETELGDTSIKRLQAVNPDLLLVMEWTGKNFDVKELTRTGLRVSLDARAPGAHGYLVLARPEMRASVRLMRNPWASRCAIPYLEVEILVDGRALHAVAMHAPPPSGACADANEQTLTGLVDEVETSRSERGSGLPHIIVGDLNALPIDRHIRRLRSLGYTDAVHQRQHRWIGTWTPRNGIPAFAPIDYALVHETLPIAGAWVVTLAESDHRMVVVDIGLPASSRKSTED